MRECSWCGKEVTKKNNHKGYCSKNCWDEDWFDRPRRTGYSGGSVRDNCYTGGGPLGNYEDDRD